MNEIKKNFEKLARIKNYDDADRELKNITWRLLLETFKGNKEIEQLIKSFSLVIWENLYISNIEVSDDQTKAFARRGLGDLLVLSNNMSGIEMASINIESKIDDEGGFRLLKKVQYWVSAALLVYSLVVAFLIKCRDSNWETYYIVLSISMVLSDTIMLNTKGDSFKLSCILSGFIYYIFVTPGLLYGFPLLTRISIIFSIFRKIVVIKEDKLFIIGVFILPLIMSVIVLLLSVTDHDTLLCRGNLYTIPDPSAKFGIDCLIEGQTYLGYYVTNCPYVQGSLCGETRKSSDDVFKLITSNISQNIC